MSIRDSILNKKADVIPATLKDGTSVCFRLVAYDVAAPLLQKLRHIEDTPDDGLTLANVEALLDWIIAATVEEDGAVTFTEDDRSALRGKSIPFIADLGRAAIKANTVEAEEETKNS
jgi:hypothetical protein